MKSINTTMGDNNKLADYRARIMKRSYGCIKCPHKFGGACPHGVGYGRYEKDVYVTITIKGEGQRKLFAKAGDKIKTHTKGICPERYAEIGTYIESYNTMTGLEFRRSEILLQMQNNLQNLDSFISDQIDDPLVEMDGGDIKLVEAVKEYAVISHKFVDRLDTAIRQEQKKVEARNVKTAMSADDVANLISEASKTIVIDEKKEAAIKRQENREEQKAESRQRIEEYDAKHQEEEN